MTFKRILAFALIFCAALPVLSGCGPAAERTMSATLSVRCDVLAGNLSLLAPEKRGLVPAN